MLCDCLTSSNSAVNWQAMFGAAQWPTWTGEDGQSWNSVLPALAVFFQHCIIMVGQVITKFGKCIHKYLHIIHMVEAGGVAYQNEKKTESEFFVTVHIIGISSCSWYFIKFMLQAVTSMSHVLDFHILSNSSLQSIYHLNMIILHY